MDRETHARVASAPPIAAKDIEKVFANGYRENLTIAKDSLDVFDGEAAEVTPLDTIVVHVPPNSPNPPPRHELSKLTAKIAINIRAQFVEPLEKLARGFERMADAVEETPAALEKEHPDWRKGYNSCATKDNNKPAAQKALVTSEQGGPLLKQENAKLFVDPASRNLKYHSGALWMSVTVPILEGGIFSFVSLQDVPIRKNDLADFFGIFAPSLENVRAENIRARLNTGVGDKIKVFSPTKTWDVCTIIKIGYGQSINIQYEGEPPDEWLEKDSVRIDRQGSILVQQSSLPEVDKVEVISGNFAEGEQIEVNYNEVNYKRKGECYLGKISRVLNGTYSIEYDETSFASIIGSAVESLQQKYKGEENVLRKVLLEQFGTIPGSSSLINCAVTENETLGVDFETDECTARSDDDILEVLKMKGRAVITAEQHAHLTMQNTNLDKRFVHEFQRSFVHKVTRVVEHGKAHVEGIREGDLIVKHNGKATSHLSKEELLKCWHQNQGETPKVFSFRKIRKSNEAGTELYELDKTHEVSWPDRGWHTLPFFERPGAHLTNSAFSLKQHQLFGWWEEDKAGELAILAKGGSSLVLTGPVSNRGVTLGQCNIQLFLHTLFAEGLHGWIVIVFAGLRVCISVIVSANYR
jgi:hypothetical protein